LQTLARPLQSDKWIYRLVVSALGLVAIFVVIGVFILKAIATKRRSPTRSSRSAAPPSPPLPHF
jgi:hypothetical protein